MYTQAINLDVIPAGVRPVIHVSQFDNQVQALRFTLYKDNQPFTIPSGAAVLINGYKPDNTAFSYAATATSEQTATFSVTQQMTAVPGDVECELRVRTASEIIGTLNFILRVEKAPLTDDSVLSETDIPLIEQAVDIAANLAEYIQQTLDAAEAASASARAAATSATDAATEAASAEVNAQNIYDMYDSINAAKTAANSAAQNANNAASLLTGITAQANTLAAGSSATVTYDATNKRFTFGIPKGDKGDEGGVSAPISGFFTMYVDDDGYLWAVSQDDVSDMFYYDETEGVLYYVTDDGGNNNG